MSNELNDTDLIEQYLLGKLSDAEIRNVEARLRNDREFARKYRLITTFPEMMSSQGRLEYEKKLAEATVPVKKKKPFRFQRPRHFKWAVLGSILVIAVALFFFFMRSNNKYENVVRKENVVHEAPIVKAPVFPLNDTTAGLQQHQEQEKKESQEVTGGAMQKAIELTTPSVDAKFSSNETIIFNWKQKTDSFTRFYIFSELHDQVVYWRGIKPGIREHKLPASYLYPGTYYWYVGTKADKRTFTISE